jgi:hypothetical protein
MSESGTGEPDVDYDTALVGYSAGLKALYDSSGLRYQMDLHRMSRKAGRCTLSPARISEVLTGKYLPPKEVATELVLLLTSSPTTDNRRP